MILQLYNLYIKGKYVDGRGNMWMVGENVQLIKYRLGLILFDFIIVGHHIKTLVQGHPRIKANLILISSNYPC